MIKIGKRLLSALLILCTLAFAAYFCLANRNPDTTAPQITFEETTITLSVHDSAEALVQGISAQDDRDGDVTESLVVEGVSSISPDRSATVTYAAFDRAGNVTKAERTAVYADYSGPRYALSAPLMFRSGYNFDILDYLTVTDPVDGDLSEKIKATLVSGDTSITEEGLHDVEVRVTNTMGDTARLTLPVEVYPSGTYNAQLYLTEYLIYLEKGSFFDPQDYLDTFSTSYTDYSLENPALQGITLDVQTDVHTAAPGTYSVTYTAKRGNYSACTRMIVIVEDPHHA